MIRAAGGSGTGRVVDHEDPDAVAELVAAVERERGRLDVLVNDIFGGDRYMQWELRTSGSAYGALPVVMSTGKQGRPQCCRSTR